MINSLKADLLCVAACAFSLLAMAGTVGDREIPLAVQELNDSLKHVYAPDRRVDLFDVDYSVADRKIMLRGVTTSAAAKQALLSGLRTLRYEVLDALQVLPMAESLEGKTYGIINVSVANLRVANDFSSEMTTQALMGMPVRVLQRDGWYRIQTPDRYIAWVHRVGVHTCTKAELDAWNTAEKVVVTSHYGFVYSRPDMQSQTVSDVVAGSRLKLDGTKGKFYQVTYPDGRQGFLPRELGVPESRWRKELKQDAASIIATAHTLMGVPYLWAGTSSKGIDCSGLMRTVLFMHDIIIPRDASQQAYKGEHIDIAPDFSNLQPGDLIFFGRKATPEKRERVVHVGMYIGQKRFIHSQGDVRVNSFDEADPLFDAYNLGRLLFATRVLPYVNREDGLNTTDKNPFYTGGI